MFPPAGSVITVILRYIYQSVNRTPLVSTAIAIRSYVLNPQIRQSFYKHNTSNCRETTIQYGFKKYMMIPMKISL